MDENEKSWRKKKHDEGAPNWLLTYGDMTTLLLAFFILLFTTATIDGFELRLILAAFPGLGNLSGGNTLQEGRLAELGNTVLDLPSTESGRALNDSRQTAVSLFSPEIRAERVQVREEERGLVVSLAADAFFGPARADLNLEGSQDVFIKLSQLLQSSELAGRTFRIEGHTDSIPPDPDGPWPTNWELSAARSISVLRLLQDYGVAEEQFQVMGLADTAPIFDNQTAEGRAYNRRVDIVILSEGHL